jgi:hypothetical protein
MVGMLGRPFDDKNAIAARAAVPVGTNLPMVPCKAKNTLSV